MKQILTTLFLIIGLFSAGCQNPKLIQNENISENVNYSQTIENNPKNENDSNVKEKSDYTINSSTETIGRIEISKLNIKEDLTYHQVKYTANGLNKVGNTIILVDDKYTNVTEGMKIYIRNQEQEKILYTIENIYKTTIKDTSFYEKNTTQICLTLIIQINENEMLIIQAKNN